MGFNGIKPALNFNSITNMSFLELYLQSIRAYQELFNNEEKLAGD